MQVMDTTICHFNVLVELSTFELDWCLSDMLMISSQSYGTLQVGMSVSLITTWTQQCAWSLST